MGECRSNLRFLADYLCVLSDLERDPVHKLRCYTTLDPEHEGNRLSSTWTMLNCPYTCCSLASLPKTLI